MKEEIKYEDFVKLDIKIARIITAEKVENSEKLLKINLSTGTEERTVVAGIGKSYAPEEMIGKQVVFLSNLSPRHLMGIESRGMILAASGETGPVLIIPEKEVQLESAVS